MTVKLLANYVPYLAGDLFSAAPNTEAGLVKLGMATTDTSGGVVNMSLVIGNIGLSVAGSLPWKSVPASRSLTSADDGQALGALSTLTLTVPSGLSPRPTVSLLPPASGQLTVTGNINGSNQSLVLNGSAANGIGWCLCANVASDGYTLLPNH